MPTIPREVSVSQKETSIPIQTKLLDSDSNMRGVDLTTQSLPPTGVAIFGDNSTPQNYCKKTHEQRSTPPDESSSESISEKVGPGVSMLPFPSVF